MSLKYIRDTYKVPAYRGQRIRYLKDNGETKYEGVITSGSGGYIRIRRDGDKCTYPAPFHPTWNLEYLT